MTKKTKKAIVAGDQYEGTITGHELQHKEETKRQYEDGTVIQKPTLITALVSVRLKNGNRIRVPVTSQDKRLALGEQISEEDKATLYEQLLELMPFGVPVVVTETKSKVRRGDGEVEFKNYTLELV